MMEAILRFQDYYHGLDASVVNLQRNMGKGAAILKGAATARSMGLHILLPLMQMGSMTHPIFRKCYPRL
jgi:hypothetical protein